MYSEKIDMLIDAALADGELTEKEKQVLFRNAQAQGIDLDEFEMVLQSRLFEKQKEQNKQAVMSAAPKSNKYGDIRKCPQCGAVVDAYTAICSECGYAFNNVSNDSEVKILADKIEKLEEERETYLPDENKKKLGFWDIVLWIYFFWLLIPIKVCKAILGAVSSSMNPKLWSQTDKKIEGIIMNYAVPNTKSELMEFAILCQSHIKEVRYLNWLSDIGAYNYKWNCVWESKLSQIRTKAQIVLKNDQKGLSNINELLNQVNQSLKKDKSSMYVLVGSVVAVILLVIVLLICFA